MKTNRLINTAIAFASLVSMSGCATTTPLKSKPPYSKISLNKPLSWGDGWLVIHLDMPAGTYTPLYEDERGYYYQAPQKITGRDSGMPLLLDGGLYLERTESKPKKIYFLRGQSGIPGKVGVGDRAEVTMQR